MIPDKSTVQCSAQIGTAAPPIPLGPIRLPYKMVPARPAIQDISRARGSMRNFRFGLLTSSWTSLLTQETFGDRGRWR